MLTSACAGATAPPPQQAPATRSLGIEPAAIRIADTWVGCSGTLPLELTNTASEGRLVLTRVASSDRAFRLAGARGLKLAPGETVSVEVRFTPAAPGAVEGSFALATDEAGAPRYRVSFGARGVEPPVRPLDLVFVLDVSTSMGGIAALRSSVQTLFERIEAESLDVRLGLTTFENDVVVHERGSFLDRETFFRELDGELVEGSWTPDGSRPRQSLNYELQENVLDALHRAASDYDFRPEARRYLFLMTDDTFLAPPAVFSDGNPVLSSYDQVATTLEDRSVSLFSVHASAKGRGLSSEYEGRASLVSETGGRWYELASARRRGGLDAILTGLLTQPDCRYGAMES